MTSPAGPLEAQMMLPLPVRPTAMAATTPAWYTVRPDRRMCMWPSCGGVFYRAVNLTKTQCANGAFATECYAASIEGIPVELDRALVYGPVEPHRDDAIAPWDALRVTEAWQAPTDSAPVGRIFDVRVHGGSYGASSLNDIDRMVLGGVDLGRLPPDDAVGAKAALESGRLMVAGWLDWDSCTSGQLVASKVWFRTPPVPPPAM